MLVGVIDGYTEAAKSAALGIATCCVGLALTACGEEFSASGDAAGSGGQAAGGAGGASVGGNGAGGQAGGSSGSGGGAVEPKCHAGRFDGATIIPLFHTTLNDADAIINPEQGAISTVSPTLSFEAAIKGSGALFKDSGDYFETPVANISLEKGTFDLCFKPNHNFDDDKAHGFFHWQLNQSESLRLVKNVGEYLVLTKGINDRFSYIGLTQDAHYVKDEWVRLTVSWNFDVPTDAEVLFYIDSVQLATMYNASPTFGVIDSSSTVLVGDLPGVSNNTAGGTMDELFILNQARVPITPQ